MCWLNAAHYCCHPMQCRNRTFSISVCHICLSLKTPTGPKIPVCLPTKSGSDVFPLCLCSPAVPANISELKNLEVLNMFNNQIEDLPTQISSLQKLKHLNLGYGSLSDYLPLGLWCPDCPCCTAYVP